MRWISIDSKIDWYRHEYDCRVRNEIIVDEKWSKYIHDLILICWQNKKNRFSCRNDKIDKWFENRFRCSRISWFVVEFYDKFCQNANHLIKSFWLYCEKLRRRSKILLNTFFSYVQWQRRIKCFCLMWTIEKNHLHFDVFCRNDVRYSFVINIETKTWIIFLILLNVNFWFSFVKLIWKQYDRLQR